MPVPALYSKLVAAGFALLVIGLGLRTYTLPMHGGPTYGDIEGLLRHALGDSLATLPGPPNALGVRTLEPRPSIWADSFGPVPAVPAPPEEPARWVRDAVRRDSSAVRAWLGSLVLVTATTSADTVETSFWRLTIHPGCPWLSRLRARSARPAGGSRELRVVALEATCPGPASP